MDINEQLFELKKPYLKEIKCLDKGFVRLVDWMGSDQRIVQAARVSYGEGTKTVREDKALIDYLLRHAHTSPFEQVQFTFHVKLPIFIARQIVRHRTACLSGDTVLWFDEPAAIKNNKRKRRNMSINEFYKKWHFGSESIYNPKRKKTYTQNIIPEKLYTVPELSEIIDRKQESIRTWLSNGSLKGFKSNTKSFKECSWQILGQDWIDFSSKKRIWQNNLQNNLSKMNLRMCDEQTGDISHTNIKDIWSNGFKEVFEVELENGYSIKMTKDHLCFSEKGWGTLEKLVELKINDKKNCSWSENSPAFCVNGVIAYQDYNWLKEKRENGLNVQQIADLGGCSYHTIRKWLKIHKLQFSPKEKSKFSGLTQRNTKRTKGNYIVSDDTKNKIRASRSGAKSNFWKGGVSSDRANIARWTTQIAHSVHKKYNYKCQICQSSKKLNAHHIDPVWHNPDLAKSFENLITLCSDCHKFVHNKNLELLFLEYSQNNYPLENFKTHEKIKSKRIITPKKLIRTYSKIKNIRYAGTEEVFDIEVEGPYHNFVANGFIVHNSLNEISGRYSVLKDEFYEPDVSRMVKQSKDNKQGSSEELLEDAEAFLQSFKDEQFEMYDNYQEYISGGMAKEMARINLPLSIYTEWYFSIDLHNLFHFLKLRMDAHAQYEVRVFADAKYQLIKDIVPNACESFDRHIINGRKFSGDEMELLKTLLPVDKIKDLAIEQGWKESKVNEFISKL